MKFAILILLASFVLLSCSEERSTNLPPASGLSGDMYLVMDSLQHKGPLGTAIDSVFSAEMEVINRTEPIFKLRWVDPRKLNFVLKQRRNLIFVFTLDRNSAGSNRIKGMFTKESLDKIKNDTSFFLTSSKNRFAKNQEVMFLVGRTQDEMLTKFKKNAGKIVEYFNKTEQERLTRSLYKSGQLKGVSELIKRNFGIEFKIPFGYQLVQEDSTFLWARQINPRDDKD
ncbi:MAG: DUF4837 family protein, partial [Cyclobacteriaceae bacterium]|nr:DUF4837 family protein [Cyclobacteriaceae bacterium]